MQAENLVLVELEGRVKGASEPFEKTTEPVPIILGEKEIVPGVEEALRKMQEGEERTVDIPPEKGFGERDPNKIVLIPLREFKNRGITPHPGMRVEVDGVPGRVLSVSGGRVRVDLNHELAGKELTYKIKLVKVVKDPKEAVSILFKRFFGKAISPEIDVKEAEILVKIPGQPTLDSRFLAAKLMFVSSVLKVLKEAKKVVFAEEFLRREQS